MPKLDGSSNIYMPPRLNHECDVKSIVNKSKTDVRGLYLSKKHLYNKK